MTGNTGDAPEPAENLLTIPEAAARLGIHEKRLRRLLTRTEYRDRTRTGTRTTRTGNRRVSLLPAGLLTDIEARLLLEAEAQAPEPNADNGDADADGDIGFGPSAFPEAGTGTTGTRTAPRQVVMSAFYERLLLEKDARIGELTTALEHERAQGRRLAEALAREQMLRALPAPQEVMGGEAKAEEATETAPGEGDATAVGETPDAEPESPGETAAKPGEGPPRGWWARLWGAGETNH